MGWINVTGQGSNAVIKSIKKPKMFRKKSLPQKVNKLARKVKKLELEKDYKTLDTSYDSTVASTGVFTLLNGIAQGDAEGTRDGNKVVVKSVQIKGAAVTADAYNQMRCIIFTDNQPNSAAPALGDILESTGNPINSFFRTTTRKRFRILYDRTVDMDTDDPISQFPNFYRKMYLSTQYSTSGNTIAAITRNSLYMLLVSDSDAVTHPAAEIYARIRYVDS